MQIHRVSKGRLVVINDWRKTISANQSKSFSISVDWLNDLGVNDPQDIVMICFKTKYSNGYFRQVVKSEVDNSVTYPYTNFHFR